MSNQEPAAVVYFAPAAVHEMSELLAALPRESAVQVEALGLMNAYRRDAFTIVAAAGGDRAAAEAGVDARRVKFLGDLRALAAASAKTNPRGGAT